MNGRKLMKTLRFVTLVVTLISIYLMISDSTGYTMLAVFPLLGLWFLLYLAFEITIFFKTGAHKATFRYDNSQKSKLIPTAVLAIVGFAIVMIIIQGMSLIFSAVR